MKNKSASFVQMGRPYRAFLRNHIRTYIRFSMVPTKSSYGSDGDFIHFLRLSEFPRLSRCLESPQLSQCLQFLLLLRLLLLLCYYCYYCFCATKRVNSTGSHPQRATTQGSPASSVQFQSSQFIQSVQVTQSSQTVAVKQSTSPHSVIRLILLIRFSQSRSCWNIYNL